MPGRRRLKRNDLFLLRLWTEEEPDGSVLWCGKVQRTVDGSAHYFQSWPGLLDLLCAIVEPDPAVVVAENGDATSGGQADGPHQGNELSRKTE